MAGDDGMTKKKKKKGRPSLLELEKRSLKQQQRQQQQQIPNSQHSNLLRRNPNPDADDGDDRKQKKHRLLLGLNSSPSFGSNWNDDSDAAPKRWKIAAGEKFSTATDTLHVSPVVSGPTTTPLPDKKLLIFILDRLQKKDTYGVFSEPVDSNELPDYHEIIGNPMDFGTVRKKLDDGAYRSLEHFEVEHLVEMFLRVIVDLAFRVMTEEKDVFLICSNAMEYNSPDTIYFRQARVMQEMAKKDFENLRQDSDDDDDSEPQIQAQPKVARRGRPPGKNLKKALESPSFDQVAPEFSSDVALPNGGESASFLGSYNLRKGPSSYRFRPSDSIVKPSYGSATNETYSTWLSEVENEFPASVVKAVMRYGMKHFAVDENRRNTYKPLTPGYGESISTIMDREWKQLVPVGLNAENSYLTSLGRFAADLGPIVWKVASKKTASSLHTGSKLSPGLVSDNKTVEQQQLLSLNESPCEGHSRRLLSPEVSGSSPSPFSVTTMHDGENAETVGLVNHQTERPLLHSQGGETQALVTCQFQRGLLANPGSDGYGRGIGMDSSHMGSTTVTSNSKHAPYQVFGAGVANNATICSGNGNNYDEKCIDSSSILHWGNGLGPDADSGSQTTWDSRLVDRQQQWQGFLMHNRAEVKPFVKEENARLGGMGSPSSGMQMGSPQQPDLALQL